MQFPKPLTWKNKKYLDTIRGLPCCVCGAPPPNDPHHMLVSGMSVKGPDAWAIPLCRKHHNDIEACRWMVLELQYGFTEVEAWKMVARCMLGWLERQGNDV